MEIQWPLVLFSLAAGTGGSLFAFIGLSEFLGANDKVRDTGAICSLALIVIGGCFSVLHLASPLHAISAITNLLSFSGISIELMLLGVCFIVFAAYLIVRKRTASETVAKVLAVAGIVFGLMLGFFCGHGYVIEAQAAWNTDTLPLAYLGTSLACGAFLFNVLSYTNGDGSELKGKSALITLAAVIISALTMIGYVAHLGLEATSAHPWALWIGVVVFGIIAALVIAILGVVKAVKLPPLYLASAGLLCSVIGGIAIRALMWLCATGFINLFSHTVPSVMLNY